MFYCRLGQGDTKRGRMPTYKLIIPGNTPSLKNSKQLVWGKGQDRPRLIASETYRAWKPQALCSLRQSPLVGKQWRYPLRVSFHFIRKDNRAFDHINIAQGPLDLMTEAGIIEDDSMKHVTPGDFSYQVKKDSPCVIVTIEERETP